MDTNIYFEIEQQIKDSLDQCALIDEYGELTYGELLFEINRFAEEIQKSGFVTNGELIGLQFSNSRYFLFGLLAIVKLHGVAFPLDSNLRSHEREALLKDMPLRTIISEKDIDTDQNLYQKEHFELSDRSFYIYKAKRISEIQHARQKEKLKEINACFMRPTSGTTGKSKGVIISHKSAWDRVCAAGDSLNVGPTDTVLWVLPMAHHFVVSLLLFLKSKTKIVIVKDSIYVDSLLEAITQHNCTVIYGAPIHYKLLAEGDSQVVAPHLRLPICTSGKLEKAVLEKYRNRFRGTKICQVYGIIEFGLPLGNIEDHDSDYLSLGRPLKHYEVDILDESGVPCKTGRLGELTIRGKGMFDAYLSPFKKSNEILRDGWFYTGDIAVRDELENITIKGRKKATIHVAGKKVFAEEVEEILNSHPTIFSSLVYSKIDPFFGEVVVADVVLAEKQEYCRKSLMKFCKDFLSSYKIPHTVKVVQALPMTQTGKLLRRAS